MNLTKEEFQQSINAVQNGRNSVHADIVKKEALRDSLNNDVEAWLAQNEIKKLPMGFTNFPDGVLPKSNFSRADAKKAEEAKKKEIEEKNKLIKAENLKQERLAKIALAKQKSDMERKLKKEKRDAEKAEKNKLKIKLQFEQKLKFFHQTDDHWRKQLLVMLRNEAKARGDKKFNAKCKIHGWSEFNIYKREARCTQCEKKTKPKAKPVKLKNNSELLERRHKLRKARDEAIAKGEKTFKFHCLKCDGDTFFIRTDGTSNCTGCRAISNRNYNESRFSGSSIRRRKIKEARQKAIADGLDHFTFDCDKCGHDQYYIKPNGSSECMNCRKLREKKYQAERNANISERKLALSADREEILRKRKLRAANIEKKLEALSVGKTKFTGECIKHGVTEYAIHGAKNKHVCLLCRVETDKAYIDRNKELFLSNKNNKMVIEFLGKSEINLGAALAKHIGVSRSVVSKWVNGRAATPDIYVEKIKEFISNNS
jgi:hypothetical protein